MNAYAAWFKTPIGIWAIASIDRKPIWRLEGSTKPQQQKDFDNEKQLEKLIEAIRSWHGIHETCSTIPQAMQQMGWCADLKHIWDLLRA